MSMYKSKTAKKRHERSESKKEMLMEYGKPKAKAKAKKK